MYSSGMARKARKAKPPRRKKASTRKSAVRRKKSTIRRKKTARRKPPARKRTTRARSKARRPKKIVRKPARPKRRTVRRRSTRPDATIGAGAARRGLGPESGGQSGDTEDLGQVAVADSESVEELVEEGQAYEAGIVDAVENAPDADKGPIRTREVPEDDVPEEYLDDEK
jgi:hypothetical protein